MRQVTCIKQLLNHDIKPHFRYELLEEREFTYHIKLSKDKSIFVPKRCFRITKRTNIFGFIVKNHLRKQYINSKTSLLDIAKIFVTNGATEDDWIDFVKTIN